jgi:hypothetical protein
MIVNDADKERLFELLYSWGDDGLQMWRDEINQRIKDRAASLAEQNFCYVGLVGTTTIRDRYDNLVEVERVETVYPVLYRELDTFCKQFGLNKLELIDVVELRRKEVTAKGKTFRAGSGTYIDRSVAIADREEAMWEDEQTRVKVEARNERARKFPIAVPMFPSLGTWKTGK